MPVTMNCCKSWIPSFPHRLLFDRLSVSYSSLCLYYMFIYMYYIFLLYTCHTYLSTCNTYFVFHF